jgi:hypothetical protein
MKKLLRAALIISAFIPVAAKAQFETFKDSVVQLYGVVMTADSLKGLPFATVMVKGQNRGTISNEQGVFSIVVLKGDQVEFSSVGYRPKTVEIPRNLPGNQYSIIQLMTEDTVYLPATIIKPRPSRAQFEREFINTNVPDDQREIARRNNDAQTRRAMMRVLPQDGREASSRYLRQETTKFYSQGQLPSMNIFNPAAWAEFIQAWKRGDFKNK